MQTFSSSMSELLAKAVAADVDRAAEERRWQRAAVPVRRSAEAERRRHRNAARRTTSRRPR